METIGAKSLYTYGDVAEAITAGRTDVTADSDKILASGDIQRLSNQAIRKSAGHPVHDYMDLAKKVAAIQYHNRDYVLMMRGQKCDYRNRQSNSSIRPSIFRPPDGKPEKLKPVLEERFSRLLKAEELLVSQYRKLGFEHPRKIERQRLLRWTIIQHYEICDTPLLDVSQSLRIAASFASLGAEEEAFLFVLGIPQVSGGISASAEADLVAVRLASVCPPNAVRPHIQEGYLLGEYPEVTDWQVAKQVEPHEVDFGQRLIAKFRFNPKTFWETKVFPPVRKSALFPSAEDDPLQRMADAIRSSISCS